MVACLIAAAVESESLASHLARGPVLAHVAVGCGLAVLRRCELERERNSFGA